MHNPDKREFVFALSQLGYKAVQTYYNSDNWKTDAPPEVIYEVLRAYKHQACAGDSEKMLANVKERSAGFRILTKESKLEGKLDFDYKKAAGENKETGLVGMKRKQKKYYDNPEPNWGPKPRATGK
mmetsp:Transcript_14412/g.24569  ORF Transcript_14412/g.24569 Transcript_14412/m.24569 type:complete len:126 (+) Transcript_14412:1339-1716(+)